MAKIEEIKRRWNEKFILAAAQHPKLYSCELEEGENTASLKNDILSVVGLEDDIAIIPIFDDFYVAEAMYDLKQDLEIFRKSFEGLKSAMDEVKTNFDDGLFYDA